MYNRALSPKTKLDISHVCTCFKESAQADFDFRPGNLLEREVRIGMCGVAVRCPEYLHFICASSKQKGFRTSFVWNSRRASP